MRIERYGQFNTEKKIMRTKEKEELSYKETSIKKRFIIEAKRHVFPSKTTETSIINPLFSLVSRDFSMIYRKQVLLWKMRLVNLRVYYWRPVHGQCSLV